MTPSEIRQYFREMAGRDQVGHAFILEGDSGEGWRKLAEEFAATVQCEHRNFCGRCPSCQAYQSGNHPDIIQVTHEKKDSIGVDEIRAQLVDDMAIKPYSSPYKVYLVDEAEKLTVQAQNALLKTLEEPPVYGIILLLTTNTEMLLPTIRSRCINLKVRSGGRVSLGLTEEQRAPSCSRWYTTCRITGRRSWQTRQRKLRSGSRTSRPC